MAPPPRAPRREATTHLLLRAYATLVLFSLLAYSAWFNLVGATGAAVVLGAGTLATLAIWIPDLARRRGARAFAWRRLPWAALGYGALAVASLAWSQWPGATALTLLLLASCTLQGVFLADALSWGEIVRALEVALRWILGLSLAVEAWVALVVRHPILPNFFSVDGEPDPHWYWVRGNLFEAIGIGPRIQGIVGNSNLLGMLCVVALVVFSVRLAAGLAERAARERIAMRIAWIAVAAWLLLRAGSATSFACAVLVAVVLLAALAMRRQRSPRGRTRVYALFTALVAAGAVAAWLGRDLLLRVAGRGEGLTGRDAIWGAVAERAAELPVLGHGFSSPWVPWDPAFDGWIVDHGITVFQAHSMWLDAFLQLGAAGVLLVAIACGALVWRAWFFAVDRPRWDADGSRPFSVLSLVPLLVVWALLVQGLTESNPIMLWGWTLVVLFSFKIKTAPVLSPVDTDAGIGTEQRWRGARRIADPAVRAQP